VASHTTNCLHGLGMDWVQLLSSVMSMPGSVKVHVACHMRQICKNHRPDATQKNQMMYIEVQ
jgi:hypothetical protein